MATTLILACGNSLRADDGAALVLANWLRERWCDPETEIRSQQQWTSELAETISRAELVIFVDASASVAAGEVACVALGPIYESRASLTHQTSPVTLLALAQQLYGKSPIRAYLVTIGGASFRMHEGLSVVVQRAIPSAVDCIRALISVVTIP
jgi:hydrogenase maturation protease